MVGLFSERKTPLKQMVGMTAPMFVVLRRGSFQLFKVFEGPVFQLFKGFRGQTYNFSRFLKSRFFNFSGVPQIRLLTRLGTADPARF
jgi:hypothetical protein